MDDQQQGKKESIMKEAVSFLIWAACVLLISFLLVHFVIQRCDVGGSSMVPTLTDGDQLLMDKISYRFRDPERFDIVVFPYEYSENTYFIKRVIGLPGETVQIDYAGTI
ncbi:MAG: signal peptidase I, partial [Lachnospiraceae bacterium]|nr:signal peptidase I [Lachnospiraceae bacterium]